MVNKLGEKVGIKLNPHDLRRHSATFASRNDVLLELICKVLLRHQNLKTTQLYLGRVSNLEARGIICLFYSINVGERGAEMAHISPAEDVGFCFQAIVFIRKAIAYAKKRSRHRSPRNQSSNQK